MKHIKTFESVKDVYNIEDSLIRFVDTGEISYLEASSDKSANTIKIDFIINKTGIEKLIVLDKIINRLINRNYHVYIYKDTLYADKVNEDIDYYINYSLVEHINKMLDNKLNGLNTYTSNEYPEHKYFGKSMHGIILKYVPLNKKLLIDKDKFSSLFENKYMLLVSDISSIIQYAVVNTLKIEVDVVYILQIYIPILNTPKIEPI